MSYIVVIPARFDSTRLPGKMLADIGGKPLIAHVVDRANESTAARVIVATDDQRIADALEQADCDVCLTGTNHQSGTDRLAEAVEILNIPDNQIVVNVQGDEPLVPGKLIDQIAYSLESSNHADISTAAKKILKLADINNPNVVKVVFSQNGEALYFSRSVIPYTGDKRVTDTWHHIGIYAYRAKFLRAYHMLSPSRLEQSERLEQLRVLDNGGTILVETVDYDVGLGVDTQEDLDYVRQLFVKSHG